MKKLQEGDMVKLGNIRPLDAQKWPEAYNGLERAVGTITTIVFYPDPNSVDEARQRGIVYVKWSIHNIHTYYCDELKLVEQDIPVFKTSTASAMYQACKNKVLDESLFNVNIIKLNQNT